MTGSLFAERHRDPVRQVARCRRCGEKRMGTTTFETMAFGELLVGRAIHFCGACEGDLIARERPLECVLADLAPSP